MNTTTDPIRAYLATIGAKGGAAGSGAAKARTREQAQAAVRARWAKRAARNDGEDKVKGKTL